MEAIKLIKISLAFLLAFLISAGSCIYFERKTNLREQVCDVQLSLLLDAIQSYRKLHGHLPFSSLGRDFLFTLDSEPSYYNLLSVLSGDNPEKNPKFVEFLQLSDTNQKLSDPWGNPYLVALDLNNDNVIPSHLLSGSGVINVSIAVWSLGPDGKEELPFINDNSGHNADNRTSWNLVKGN